MYGIINETEQARPRRKVMRELGGAGCVVIDLDAINVQYTDDSSKLQVQEGSWKWICNSSAIIRCSYGLGSHSSHGGANAGTPIVCARSFWPLIAIYWLVLDNQNQGLGYALVVFKPRPKLCMTIQAKMNVVTSSRIDITARKVDYKQRVSN